MGAIGLQVKLKLLSLSFKALHSLLPAYDFGMAFTAAFTVPGFLPCLSTQCLPWVDLAAPFVIFTCHYSSFFQGPVHMPAPPESLFSLLWSELSDPLLWMNTDLYPSVLENCSSPCHMLTG